MFENSDANRRVKKLILNQNWQIETEETIEREDNDIGGLFTYAGQGDHNVLTSLGIGRQAPNPNLKIALKIISH